MSLDCQSGIASRHCHSMTIARLLVIAGSGVFLAMCSSQPPIMPTPQPALTITYLFTTEATYTRIEVNQDTLSYTFFDDENNACAQWIRQEPCWTQHDLKTEQVSLSESDIQALVALIQQETFMELSATCGNAPPGQRYYPYRLEVKLGETEKEVVYQSFPEAPPMPDAMAKIIEKLEELAEQTV